MIDKRFALYTRDASSGWVDQWSVIPDSPDYELLVADAQSWEYEDSGWMLLQDKTTGALMEVQGGHCSCYGYEGQFDPKPTSDAYLLSDKFHLRDVPEVVTAIRAKILGGSA
jgi:hypothetical protein